jgi:hypothetical protein
MPETTVERTRLSPILIAGILVFSVALIVLVLGVARGNVATQSALETGPVFLGSDIHESSFDAGTEVDATLDAGTYGIWMSGSDVPTPQDVAVTAPDGAPVAVRSHSSILTMAAYRGTADLSLLLAFDAPVDGTYRVAATDTTPAAVFVIGPAYAVSPVFSTVALGGVVLGVVLMLVGLAQNRRRRPPRPPSHTDDPVLR